MKIIKLPNDVETVVDDDVYLWANNYKWHLSMSGYVQRKEKEKDNGKRKSIFLHKEILVFKEGFKKDLEGDHKNHNKLDNLYSNLRWCTRKQNSCNIPGNTNASSKFKGVHVRGNKWRACIYPPTGTVSLGYFNSEEDAARAYDKAALFYHGEFACLNFPTETTMLRQAEQSRVDKIIECINNLLNLQLAKEK